MDVIAGSLALLLTLGKRECATWRSQTPFNGPVMPVEPGADHLNQCQYHAIVPPPSFLTLPSLLPRSTYFYTSLLLHRSSCRHVAQVPSGEPLMLVAGARGPHDGRKPGCIIAHISNRKQANNNPHPNN